MHFANIFKLYTRVYQQVLLDLQIYFAYDFQIAFLKKIVVGKNASGNGIFNCHYAAVAFFFIRSNFYHFSECCAANNFHIFSKKLPGRPPGESCLHNPVLIFFYSFD